MNILSKFYSFGFIILDYPHNIIQATILKEYNQIIVYIAWKALAISVHLSSETKSAIHFKNFHIFT